ncbi:MAG: response regulator [Rubrivivax sp.]
MQSVKTFIVEDSPLIRDGLIETLEEFTAVQVVGTAADEASAVRWLTDDGRDCDLMIIDIFLKGGSGLGVLKLVRQAGLRGKRVVLTNYATDDIRRTCEALGADRVFDKSQELEELIAYCTQLAGDTRPGALG